MQLRQKKWFLYGGIALLAVALIVGAYFGYAKLWHKKKTPAVVSTPTRQALIKGECADSNLTEFKNVETNYSDSKEVAKKAATIKDVKNCYIARKDYKSAITVANQLADLYKQAKMTDKEKQERALIKSLEYVASLPTTPTEEVHNDAALSN